MKNKNEISGLAINIFVVVLLLAFVIIGLNMIGLYSLPESIEKLLGSAEESALGNDNNDEGVYSLIEGSTISSSVEVVELDYTNARTILENLKPSESYTQNVVVTHYFGNNSKTQNMSVARYNGLYEVAIYDSKNKPLKNIKETSHHVVISSLESDNGKDVVIPKGNFDISSECGFVVNVDEFLKHSEKLDEGDFSQFSDDNGSFMIVSFDSDVDGVVYSQQYTVSIDFGVVTKAFCYEDEKLIYEMITTGLSD